MDAKPRIFFTRSYTYRKPGTLLGGLLALAFGGLAFGRLVVEIPRTEWSWSVLATGLFVGGISGLLAFSGFWVVRQWFGRTSLLLEISDAGIRYGKVGHSWEKIRWISGHTDRKHISLFYQTNGRGLSRFDRSMPVDPNLTLEEYQDLMHDLSSALSERHPNVAFG